MEKNEKGNLLTKGVHPAWSLVLGLAFSESNLRTASRSPYQWKKSIKLPLTHLFSVKECLFHTEKKVNSVSKIKTLLQMQKFIRLNEELEKENLLKLLCSILVSLNDNS